MRIHGWRKWTVLVLLSGIAVLVVLWVGSYHVSVGQVHSTWAWDITAGRICVEGGWNVAVPDNSEFGTPGSTGGFIGLGPVNSPPINATWAEYESPPLIRFGARWCVLLSFWQIGLVLLAGIGATALPMMLSRSGSNCVYCGYDLRGSTTPKCPECGAVAHRSNSSTTPLR